MYERLLKYATERRDECSKMANSAKDDFERVYQTACIRYWAGYIDGLKAMKEAQDNE